MTLNGIGIDIVKNNRIANNLTIRFHLKCLLSD